MQGVTETTQINGAVINFLVLAADRFRQVIREVNKVKVRGLEHLVATLVQVSGKPAMTALFMCGSTNNG